MLRSLLFLVSGLSLTALAGAQPEDRVLSLREAVHQALENNLSLGIARLDPQIAQDTVAIEAAAFDLSFFGAANYSSNSRPIASETTQGTETTRGNYMFGVQRPFSTGTLVTAQTVLDERDTNALAATSTRDAEIAIDVRQQLWQGFGRNVNLARLRRARVGSDVERLLFRNSILEILSFTEVAYWQVAYSYENRALVESSILVAESLLQETRERERLGLATRLEVLQARANLAERQEDVLTAQEALESANDALLSLLGSLNDAMALDQVQTVYALPQNFEGPPPFSEVWPRAIGQNVNTAVQEGRIEQIRLDRLVAHDRTRPMVEASAGIGVLGVHPSSRRDAYDSALDRDGHFWRVGIQFNVPWGFAAERASLRQVDRRIEQEEIRLVSVRQALLEETRRTWRRLNTNHERLAAATLTLELQEETFAQERSRFEAGLSTFRAVLESQRDLDVARNSQLLAVIELLRAEVELARVDGSLLQRHGFDWKDVEEPTLADRDR